jgi:single-stranded DNA-binding protein
MNNGTYVINLGADPETIQLGEKEGRKLRCAEKAPGKKNVTRWFNAIVTGYDNETADRLRKGDTLIVMGQMGLEEYAPKKPRYKGEKIRVDVMNFAKIFQVVKSPSFFGGDDDEGSGETTTAGVTEAEAPDIAAGDDPLAAVY